MNEDAAYVSDPTLSGSSGLGGFLGTLGQIADTGVRYIQAVKKPKGGAGSGAADAGNGVAMNPALKMGLIVGGAVIGGLVLIGVIVKLFSGKKA